MPGILPMKVIKIGSNCQSRIAQACDRCRSKKIRCDGSRPSCTQCVNVGFECQTSDKLSRRAFPRGYTESLEERVRLLEAEVRELKDLLDEKDEAIDMLSRIHPNSPSLPPLRRPSFHSSHFPVRENPRDKDDTFKLHPLPLLLFDGNDESCCVGSSSGRMFIEALKQKAQDSGRLSAEINSGAFFGTAATSSTRKQGVLVQIPPRLVSDQLINIFFQEWAPLFPVLHRPTFLSLYEHFVAGTETVVDKKSIAKLNLVFGIAALSGETCDAQNIDSYEAQWHNAIESILMENDIATLQCLILAQIFCLLKPDYSRLLKYKGLAIGLSQHLGLHRLQKQFALDALARETRKKVFWALYTLDCFSAAHLGLPKLIREDNVHCEYPVDADDEYITENGFLPTPPGEYTKVSSALALFRMARILAKVLAELYPTSASHKISLCTITAIADELEDWQSNLAPHLKLTFAQEKPSTNVTSSRALVLSLAYHHVRSLIYRPVVIANLSERGSSALVAVGDACKHIIQIVQLLDERKLSFSFCLNRNEVLVQAGSGLLFQSLSLARDGKLIKDCNRLIGSVMNLLEEGGAKGSADFRRLGYSIAFSCAKMPAPVLSRHSSTGQGRRSWDGLIAGQAPHATTSGRHTSSSILPSGKVCLSRRATITISPSNKTIRASPSSMGLTSFFLPTKPPPVQFTSPPHRNIDYLSFDTDPLTSPTASLPPATHTSKTEVFSSDWERLLSSLDNGQTNIYDTIYGGPPADALIDAVPLSVSSDSNSPWPSIFCNWNSCTGQQAAAQSVLSFSDESLTSGEEFGRAGFECGGGEGMYSSILIPRDSLPPSVLEGLDAGFGL